MLTSRKITKLMDSRVDVMMLAVTLNSDYIGRYDWRDTGEYNRMLKAGDVLQPKYPTLFDLPYKR
jgi:hypothetical protein